MNTNKRFIAFFLAVTAVLTLSAQVWAAESKSSTAAERGEGSHAISPRMTCTVCKGGNLSLVCEKERIWDHAGKHGNNCLVNYFRSGGHYSCGDCGATRPVDYADEFGGEHLCVEIHGSCGASVKSICPLGYTPPSPPFPSNEEITEE